MSLSPLLLSIEIAALSTLLCALGGVALGALLSSRKLPGRDLLDAVLTAPMVLPPTVLGYYLLVALGRESPLGRLFEELTGSPLVFTRAGAVVAATAGALPLAIKASRAAFESVDPTLLAAASTLGAGPLRVFVTITLPLARRGILSGIALSFARSLGDFGATLMVAGNIPGQTQTASLAIYDLVQAGRDRDALAMIAALTAVAVASLFAVNRLARKASP